MPVSYTYIFIEMLLILMVIIGQTAKIMLQIR